MEVCLGQLPQRLLLLGAAALAVSALETGEPEGGSAGVSRGSGPPTLRDRNPMIGWDPLNWRRLESLVTGLVWYSKLLWEAGTPSHPEIGVWSVYGEGGGGQQQL